MELARDGEDACAAFDLDVLVALDLDFRHGDRRVAACLETLSLAGPERCPGHRPASSGRHFRAFRYVLSDLLPGADAKA